MLFKGDIVETPEDEEGRVLGSAGLFGVKVRMLRRNFSMWDYSEHYYHVTRIYSYVNLSLKNGSKTRKLIFQYSTLAPAIIILELILLILLLTFFVDPIFFIYLILLFGIMLLIFDND